MKKFNKIFPILILVILIIATFVLCSCDFSSTNNNRNNTNSNEQLNSDNKYSGTIGAQKPMSLTPNTAINSDMTALQMMNASISNYYAADYAANLCVKGGVDSNFGSIHIQQNVRTLKVREGKASDSSVRYFNYSKSFGLANIQYITIADFKNLEYSYKHLYISKKANKLILKLNKFKKLKLFFNSYANLKEIIDEKKQFINNELIATN